MLQSNPRQLVRVIGPRDCAIWAWDPDFPVKGHPNFRSLSQNLRAAQGAANQFEELPGYFLPTALQFCHANCSAQIHNIEMFSWCVQPDQTVLYPTVNCSQLLWEVTGSNTA